MLRFLNNLSYVFICVFQGSIHCCVCLYVWPYRQYMIIFKVRTIKIYILNHILPIRIGRHSTTFSSPCILFFSSFLWHIIDDRPVRVRDLETKRQIECLHRNTVFCPSDRSRTGN